uniref:Uncharacterized protein n=1 Tax=Oryza punctata TaxID=4537 RepID=A0A0E0JXB3_ORYPU
MEKSSLGIKPILEFAKRGWNGALMKVTTHVNELQASQIPYPFRKNWRFGRLLPKSSGIVPFRLLNCKLSSSREERLNIEEGTGPSRLLSDRSRTVSSLRFPSDLGMVPSSLLFPSTTKSKDERFPSQVESVAGIGPWMEL